MKLIVDLVVVFVVAAAVGLGATWLTIDRAPAIDGVRIGPWLARPSIGTSRVDPYALAVLAQRGEIPLAVADGIAFTATRDDERQILSGDCRYMVEGTIPSARAWTLSAHTRAGGLTGDADGRHGFTQSEPLRTADGRVRITLSATARPGDWLPVSPGAPFVLVLRLYDTTAASLGRRGIDMPAIKRLGCS